jgi:outer membrane murein-binding lipoprotein Lpp
VKILLLVLLFLSGCCTCKNVEVKIDELSSRMGELERWIIEQQAKDRD